MEPTALIVLALHNHAREIRKSLPGLQSLCGTGDSREYDILIVDDGSDDDIDSLLEENQWMRCIRHECQLGYGASFISAYKYARDFNYELMITLDPDNREFLGEIRPLIENIRYGYDIVSCSRILENYGYGSFPQSYMDITTQISGHLSGIINETLTDPLSVIKAVQVKSLENMELTEFNHGLLLQLWIQSVYFGLSFIEIPANSANSFGSEFDMDEDPLGAYLSIIEAEKNLYNRGSTI